MCQVEGRMLQRGMTFRTPPDHGIILMSQRPNAPYADILDDDGHLIYEGHDSPRVSGGADPKRTDQPRHTSRGSPTENGRFADWTDRFKVGQVPPARFRVYEKVRDGIWNYRGTFLLKDYTLQPTEGRTVFKFVLKATDDDTGGSFERAPQPLHDAQTRQIPTWVKQEVYKRDKGRCVECGASDHLHFDHDLPFSKGGSGAIPQNVRILCARHNLAKSDKIQ